MNKSRQLVRSLFAFGAIAIAAAFAACGTQDNSKLSGTGGTGATGTGGAGGSSILSDGGIVNLGGGSATDGGVPIKQDLPDPWLYYQEGNDYAYKDPSASAGIRDAFQGTIDPNVHPTLVYPLDHSMHPMNLGQIDFQWKKGSASEVAYRIDATDGTKNYHFYVPCVPAFADCQYQMPESEWLHLGYDYRGKSLTFSITGTDNAGTLTQSAPIQIFFSPEEVNGALYYWAAGKSEIKRAAFGARQAVPLITPSSTTNAYACAACHSVSRSGNVIGFSVCNERGENVAGIQIAPTDAPDSPWFAPTMGTTPYADTLSHVGESPTGYATGQPTDHFGTSLGLSPDGSVAAVNGISTTSLSDGWPPWLALWDSQTGTVIDGPYMAGDPIFGGGNNLAIWPEFSADGSEIVVQVVGGNKTNAVWAFSGNGSGIGIMPVTNNKLGTVRMIVNPPAVGFHYYPSLSPDQKWVVFASAVTDTDKKGTNNSNQFQDAVLRLARTDGAAPVDCPGPGCIELTRGTQYTVADAQANQGMYSTWPKFAPFAQGPNKNIMFVTYTSAAPYGTLLPNGGLTQLWLFAIDLDKVGTEDPSYAPVWIPYQDVQDASLSPYWTEVIPCYAPQSGGCSGCVAGETCFVSGNTCECRNENQVH